MAPIFTGFRFGFSRGPSDPTYSVSPSTASVNEGSSVTFTVTTANISDGTTLYWTTNTISGTVNTSDFSDSAITGSFTITNNTATITRTLTNDVTTEGSESFQLQVRTGSTSGTIVATSSTVTIADTSLTPVFSATGGTTSTIGSYTIHTFLSPGTLTVSSGTNTVEYLVVAGGSSGAGGHELGGAGGQVLIGSTPVSSPMAITVGNGGAATPNSNATYNSGSPSSFGPAIIATGGGAGGSGIGPAPENAAVGSFGIGSGGINYTPSGPTLETRRGGDGRQSSISGTNLYYGGGGGGAGGAGYETSQGGRGGYGGGGGGGTGPGGSGGTPGNQNGTYGSSTGPLGAGGVTNSGGGGGSGGIGACGATYCSGNAGGPGIVIARYLT